MNSYKNFAYVYDDVMGSRKDVIKYVHELIISNHPGAESLLDLGCGTGSLLSHLSKYYTSTGIDLSSDMLAHAKKKLPKVNFSCQDICNLNLNEKFDVIICVFDTINHITSLKKWEMIFAKVAKHLSADGVFIFDINTIAKINRYSSELPYALEGKYSTCVVNVTPIKGCKYSLDITAFSRISGNNFRRFVASIPEVTFKQKLILSKLSKYFRKVTLKDPDRIRVSKNTEELYFVCMKPKMRLARKIA